MKAFHAYLRPGSTGDRDVQLAALEAFASQLGAPQRATMKGSWRAQVTSWVDTPERPTRLSDRPQAAAMLRSIEDGAVLVTPTLGDLCDFPADLDGLFRAALARGIAIYALELPGASGSTLQPAVAACAAAFRPLEDARKQLEAELAATQANAERRLEQALQAGMAQLAANWGLPSALRIGLPELGDVATPPDGKAGHLGEAVAKARKERGLTQAQLAKEVGVSQAAVSRIESTGAGDALSAVLDFLFTEQGGDENETAS